jgi:hypothetical protein
MDVVKHCLPANRAFQKLEHAVVLLIWQKKHDKWQNSHHAHLQQLQTALIISVTFI